MGINQQLIEKYKPVNTIISDFYKLRDKSGKLVTVDKIVTPLKIDNRQLMSPTDDQGSLPACAGFSACTLIESIIWKHTGKLHQLNSEQVYAKAKTLDGMVNEEGTYLESALNAMMQLAHIDNLGIKIGLSYNDNTENTINVVKHLIHKYSFMQIGFQIDDAWYKCNNSNFILTKGSIPAGGHAVNIVGYDTLGFYILNQWGVNWGAKGYCIMPYDVFLKEYMYCAYLYNIPDEFSIRAQ